MFDNLKIDSRAVTLIEILVVSAVIAACAGTVYYFIISFSANEQRISKEQEFVQLEARMLSQLRNDLRSTNDFNNVRENCFIINRYYEEDGKLLEDKISWTYYPEKQLIIREGNTKNVYDYSKLLPEGEKIVFQIR